MPQTYIHTVGLDFSAAERQAQQFSTKLNSYFKNINAFSGGGVDRPLGKLSANAQEFEKSMAAANARVLAFGASVSVIYGVQRAFTEMVKAGIEVEKQLTDINVILNASGANLEKFGNNLFDIARNTGQSFRDVASAATEFARQGLGMEETLKRTNDALVLTRLSGIGARESVEALTATINSFSKAALDSTEVVSKFAAVDAAFAISAGDLAKATESSAAEKPLNQKRGFARLFSFSK
jgi:phage-related minor tail protein